MELYTIFRGNYRFVEGEHSEKQKKINANFNETDDLVVESLFGHQNQSEFESDSGWCKILPSDGCIPPVSLSICAIPGAAETCRCGRTAMPAASRKAKSPFPEEGSGRRRIGWSST